jgi:hypothetical protein
MLIFVRGFTINKFCTFKINIFDNQPNIASNIEL